MKQLVFKRTELKMMKNIINKMIDKGQMMKENNEQENWKFKELKSDFKEALNMVFYGSSEAQIKKIFASEDEIKMIKQKRNWPNEKQKTQYWNESKALSPELSKVIEYARKRLMKRYENMTNRMIRKSTIVRKDAV